MSKKEYLFGFAAIFIAVFGVYWYTMAPTASFWDCGEYIACAYSLGVPHPPGGPLHVLIRRIFTLIPFGYEIGFRSNMLSVLTGAIMAGLVGLIIVKIINRTGEITSKYAKIGAWVAGAAGAFIAAFAYTPWWNSVESEAYGISTFVFILCLFLAFLWDENIKTQQHKKYLLLIIYLMALSSGIHLIPLLAAPGILLFVFLRNREVIKDAELLRFIVLVIPFFALSASVPLPIVGIIFAGVVVFILLPHGSRRDSKLLAVTTLLFVIGFTTYAYLIIRARQNPNINEVAPTNIQRLWEGFSRKQYGPNKLSTVFARETAAQTGYNLPHAFYEQIKFFTTYLSWQWVPFPRQVRWEGEILTNFTRFGSIIINILFVCISFFGIWTHYKYKKDRTTFWLMFTTFLIATIALIFYMNFKFSPSDPNPLHTPREVRERHYFFGPAFILFGLYVGLGFWGIISTIKRGAWLLRPAIGILALVPVIGNFHSHVNRRGLWLPDDYGHNMLASCDDGAVIFTNGDNDTFPLWFVQEVKHIKPSVTVANLSLLNTEWYIKQLKQRGVPMSLTDWEADNIMPFPVIKDGQPDKKNLLLIKDFGVRDILAINGGYEFERKIFMPIKREKLPKELKVRFPKEMDIIPPSYYVRRLPQKYWLRLPEEYFLPTEEFAALVLKDYKSKIPVYFAVTVSSDNTKGLEPHLRMEALVKRVTPGGARFDILKTDSLLNKVYRYRGIFDPSVYKDENSRRLLTNYAAAYFALGMAYKNQGQIEKAIEALEMGKQFKAGEIIPFAYQLAVLYEVIGEHEKAEANLRELPEEARGVSAWYTLGQFHLERGNLEKAEESFKKALEIAPQDPGGYAGLIELYHEQQDDNNFKKILEKCIQDPVLTGKIVSIFKFEKKNHLAALLLENWLSYHPYDTVARGLLQEFQNNL